MAINKNFVVKNGFEVNANLIVADAANDRVGIGTTIPKHQLHIIGGIGATHSFVTGVSTISNELRVGTGGEVFSVIAGPSGVGQSVGVGTSRPAFLLDVHSPVSIGQTALRVRGDGRITGNLVIESGVTLSTLNVTGISTFVGFTTFQDYVFIQDGLNVTGTGATLNSLNVTGVSTFVGFSTFNDYVFIQDGLDVTGAGATIGTVKISSGIITATSGVVTYFGDGSQLTGNARNLTATIGIGTSGVAIGYGVSFIDFRGPGLSTIFYNSTVGIATVNIIGGGGDASIGIGTTPGEAFTGIITAGNLWYNSGLGRLFIYYQDDDSAQWVDAAPFNVGIITAVGRLLFENGTALEPSLHFANSSTTGLFSPTAGQQTFVSVGSSILNINPAGIRVTGVATATDFDALSDINYKKNINTVNDALLKVDQLRGVKFDWKESGLPSYGVIAQELQEVLPELVHGNDPKTVNYNGIIGVLIEAIKELKAEVEELKSVINK